MREEIARQKREREALASAKTTTAQELVTGEEDLKEDDEEAMQMINELEGEIGKPHPSLVVGMNGNMSDIALRKMIKKSLKLPDWGYHGNVKDVLIDDSIFD